MANEVVTIVEFKNIIKDKLDTFSKLINDSKEKDLNFILNLNNQGSAKWSYIDSFVNNKMRIISGNVFPEIELIKLIELINQDGLITIVQYTEEYLIERGLFIYENNKSVFKDIMDFEDIVDWTLSTEPSLRGAYDFDNNLWKSKESFKLFDLIIWNKLEESDSEVIKDELLDLNMNGIEL